MQCDLKIELFEGNAAMSYGKSFVDEFDGKDGGWAFKGPSFLDTGSELAYENNSNAVRLAMHMLLVRWFLK